MVKDYRRVLRENVQACLARSKKTRDSVHATYLGGPKRGKRLSPRTITNILSPEGPGPSIDAIAALAEAFGLLPWQLLVPGLDPANAPTLRLTPAERKLHDEFERLKRQLIANDDQS